MSEHDEQAELFAWAEFAAKWHPDLQRMFAIPNGGLRHKAVAAKLKAEGVKAGVLDVFLPAARGGFYGLFVEMKYGKNKPTIDQKWWLENLSLGGYKTTVCYSATQAKDVIEKYLALGQIKSMVVEIA